MIFQVKSITTKIFFIYIFCCNIHPVSAQNLYFPPNNQTQWDTMSIETLGWCPERINDLYNYLENNQTKGFIILKNGKMVLEKYFGGFTKDSLWYWASAGKTVTSFMVGVAQQEGKLNLSQTSSSFLGNGWTSCATTQENQITIRHQLTMTSGLDDGLADPYCTLPNCLSCIAPAGERWAYHNAPYTLLDKVIENATSTSFNAYFISKLRNPIGMNGQFFQIDYNNILVSNVRSMARFGLLILNKGRWGVTPIMQDTAFFNQMVNTSQQLNKSYGYLWWLNGKESFRVPGLQIQFPGPLFRSAPNDMISAIGKNGQILNVIPSQQLVIIRMGNAPTSSEVPFTMNDSIMKYVQNLPCVTQTKDHGLDENSFDIYPNPSGDILFINNKMKENFSIQLYNDLGHRVLTDYSVSNIDVSSYPNGIYFLAIRNNLGTLLKKIVIQH